jgi:DNA-binding MarR family transcriptional regulator
MLKAMHDFSRRMELAHGVSGPQLWVLWHLRASRYLPIGELAKRVYLHPSTVTRLADGLERKGMVERHRDSADHRVVRLELTPTGRELLRDAPTPMGQRLLDTLARMPEAVLAPLAEGLTYLADVADRAASGETGNHSSDRQRQ